MNSPARHRHAVARPFDAEFNAGFLGQAGPDGVSTHPTGVRRVPRPEGRCVLVTPIERHERAHASVPSGD